MADLNMIKPRGVQNLINKFCFTIGMLPTSYKDSLTYEEQILAIGHYLETTVYPAINNNAEALTELQGLFVALEDYVNNYFDNLDVQEEINNKLDDMAESGDLENIIAAYINTKAIFGYDTVADMISAENLDNGSYAKTLGYHSKNDGGKALYKIRTITNEDVVDNATIISMTNENLVAELIPENKTINAKQFGCYGDNTNDDTTNLQKLIDYGITNNYSIYIDKSNYLISDTIEIHGNRVNLKCDGQIRTITNNITLIEYYGQFSNIYIDTIRRNDENNRSGIAFKCTGGTENNITINTIIDFSKGISLDTSDTGTNGIYYNKIYNNFIRANNCIYMNANLAYINSNYFYLGQLSGTNAIVSEAITETHGEYNGNYFYDMGFENMTGSCVDLHNADWNEFSNFRLIESVTGSKFFKLDTCRKNKFTTESVSEIMQEDKIQDNQPNRKDANIFDMYITKYGDTRSRYSRKSITYNNIIEVVENGNLPNGIYFENQDYSTSGTNLNVITDLLCASSTNDVNIYLDDRFNYDNFYTKNLFIRNGAPGANHAFKIFKSDGTQMLDIKTQYFDTGLAEPGKPIAFKLELSILPDESKVYRFVRVLTP